jgi:phosphohistidine phosphatase
MDILLVRHGQAVDEALGLGDAGRWLTTKGRKVSRKVAKWIAKNGKRRPTVIWTSPLVRAVQTAEILASEAAFKGEVLACAQLSPGHDPGDLLKLLAAAAIEGPIALVGHEPSLSLIANALLGDVGFTGLKKSGVLGLTWDPPSSDPDAAPGAAVPGEPASSDAPPTSAPTARNARLWFVLDPARMKSRKRIDPLPAAEPASTTDEA